MGDIGGVEQQALAFRSLTVEPDVISRALKIQGHALGVVKLTWIRLTKKIFVIQVCLSNYKKFRLLVLDTAMNNTETRLRSILRNIFMFISADVSLVDNYKTKSWNCLRLESNNV